MPSLAFEIWRQDRHQRLEEIAQAHTAVGGSQRGRRFATNQINHAYAMLVSAEFQGFCRDLHSECIDHICRQITHGSLQNIIRDALFLNRKLDTQNPNPGNLGSDFQRLGINFWDRVRADDGRNESRRELLEELNLWRNAIAHQDFSRVGGSMALRLSKVRDWRRACDGLTVSFNEVLRQHLLDLFGVTPWA